MFLTQTSGDYDLKPFREQFGIITVPPDPAEPAAQIRFSAQFIRYARSPSIGGSAYTITTTLQDHEVLVWFDLSGPIEAQLKSAKRLLTEQAKGVGQFRFRYRPKGYAKYLRLLDAKAAQAPDAQVAKVLYPSLQNKYPDHAGNRQVRDDRSVAKALRDNPWRIVAGAA